MPQGPTPPSSVSSWPTDVQPRPSGPAVPSSHVCSGDLVRAVTADRSADVVEGVLQLRHVPALDYVQVLVLGDERSWFVDPASIEVLESGLVDPAQLEADDPVRHDPGWRSHRDLAEAMAAGLVHAVPERRGGSWADLHEALAGIVAPLVKAAWTVEETGQDSEAGWGDSVHCDLSRNGQHIEVELIEDGGILGWALPALTDEDFTDDGQPYRPLFDVPNASVSDAVEAYRAQGWLEPGASAASLPARWRSSALPMETCLEHHHEP